MEAWYKTQSGDNDFLALLPDLDTQLLEDQTLKNKKTIQCCLM